MALGDILVKVDADVAGYTRKMKEAGSRVERMGHQVSQANAKVEQQSDRMTRAERKMRDYGDSVSETAAAISGISFAAFAGLTGVIATLTTRASQFEDAFVQVQKTVGGTDVQFAELEKEIRNMSKTMPKTTEEISEVAAAAGRLGVKREDISEFTRVMMMMGDASNLSASEAADSLARFMNIMGTSNDDVERLGSSITHSGNNAATSEKEIGEMSQRNAGAAAQANMSETDVLAFAATMSELGIRSEAGGSALSRVILEMNSAVKGGGEELEGFAEIAGMSADQFAQAFERDAAGATAQFIEGLNGISKCGGDVAGALADVGFSELRVRDALLRMSEATGNLNENLGLSKTAWEENTALAAEAERVYGTFSAKLKIVWNKVRDVMLIFGKPLMNALSTILDKVVIPLVDWIGNLADAFDSLSEPTKNAIGMLAVVATGAVGVTAAVSGAVAVLGKLTSWLAKGGSGATGFVGKLTRITSITGLVAAGIGVVVTAVMSLYKWFTRASKEERELTESMGEVGDSAKELGDTLEESARDYEKLESGIDKTSGANTRLLTEITKLSDKENKSAADKERLANMVDDLNNSVDNLSITYDKESDSMDMNARQIRARIGLMKQEQTYEAAQERMTQILSERNDAEFKLEEINDERNKYNDLLDKNGKLSGEAKEKYEQLGDEQERLKGIIGDLNEEEQKRAEEVREEQEKMARYTRIGVEQQILAYEDLPPEQQKVIDQLRDQFGQLADASANIFTEMAEDVDISFDEIKKTLKKNKEDFAEWADNMDQLVEWGVDEGLIRHIRDAGLQMAPYLAAIVGEGKEGAIELGEMFEETYQQSIDKGAKVFEMDEKTVDSLRDLIDDVGITAQEALEGVGWGDLTEEATDDMAQGFKDGEDGVVRSVKDVVDKVRGSVEDGLEISGDESGVFKGFGDRSATSYERGIDKKVADVERTVVDFVNNNTKVAEKEAGLGVGAEWWSIGDGMGSNVEVAIDGKKKDVGASVEGVFNTANAKANQGLNKTKKTTDSGVSKIGQSVDKLAPKTDKAFGSMGRKIDSGGKTSKRKMTTVASGIQSPFVGLSGKFSTFGVQAMSGLHRGLIGQQTSLLRTASNIASKVSGRLRSGFKIASPSRVTKEIGAFVGKGLNEGLLDTVRIVMRASDALVDAAMPDMPRNISLGIDDMARDLEDRKYSMSAQVDTEIRRENDDERHDVLVNEIKGLKRSMANLKVIMNDREVGRIVEPAVSEIQDRNGRIKDRF